MTELYINGQRVDFINTDSLGFRLNKIIKSQNNFGVQGGTFSSNIELPNTSTNAKILGIFEINSFKNFKKYVQLPAKIAYGGQDVITGTVLIDSLNKRSINIRFIGDDSDFAVQLEKYTLQDLDILMPFNPVEDGLINSHNQGWNDAVQSNVIFPLINYNGQPETFYNDFTSSDVFGLYDSATPPNLIRSELSFPEEFNVKQGLYNTSFGLTFRDMPPAVRYVHILDKIFEKIGYKWNSSLKLFRWFNKLFMPYVGEGYIWNWATLAKLDTTHFYVKSVVPQNPQLIIEHETYTVPNAGVLTPPSPFTVGRYIFFNSMNRQATALPPLVLDRGWNVLNTQDERKTHYIVPQDGKYNIKAQVFYDVNLLGAGANFGELNVYGNGSSNYGWDDLVILIYRKTKDDEFGLNTEILQDVARFMANNAAGVTSVTSQPSDILAFLSTKRFELLNNDPTAVGSPFSNFQILPIATTLSPHTPNTSVPSQRRVTGEYRLEIEMDLKQGERIYATAVKLIDLINPFSSARAVDFLLWNVNFQLEINNLDGDIALDLARNLPPMPLKTFIKGFTNLFGLQFEADGFNKSVTFLTKDELRNARLIEDAVFDLTNDVDENSISMYPCPIPTKMTLGFTNDEKDVNLSRQIQTDSDGSNLNTEYGQKVFSAATNIYAEDEYDYKTLFSSTRFINATFNNANIGVPFALANPLTSNLFFGGFKFAPVNRDNNWQIPSIQSIEQSNVTKFANFNLDFNYKPRLLYYLGYDDASLTTNGARLVWAGYYPNQYANRVTVYNYPMSFDLENMIFAAAHITNPNSYPSLRFDSANPNNLFNLFHKNYLRELEDSHDVEVDVNLNWTIYNRLTLGKLVKIQDGLFEILEIKDFDPEGKNLTKLKLRKIV